MQNHNPKIMRQTQYSAHLDATSYHSIGTQTGFEAGYETDVEDALYLKEETRLVSDLEQKLQQVGSLVMLMSKQCDDLAQ